MAERRMISLQIVDTDAFLEMPATAQNFYFHLVCRADDDGFVGNPKRLLRLIGASEDDARILIAKNFVIPFESGVIAITHWYMHNYIKKDRYHPTIHTAEKQMLSQDENGKYILAAAPRVELLAEENTRENEPEPKWNQVGTKLEPEVRLGKVRLGKVSIDMCADKAAQTNRKRFCAPTLEEVAAYCRERKNNVDPVRFTNYYDSNGWKVGRNAMKDWKAAVRTWEQNGFDSGKKPETAENASFDINELYCAAVKAANIT